MLFKPVKFKTNSDNISLIVFYSFGNSVDFHSYLQCLFKETVLLFPYDVRI
jgi:hypothetical protein